MLEFPGRSETLALQGHLLCRDRLRVCGQIKTFLEDKGYGFVTVKVDVSGLPDGSDEKKSDHPFA